MTRRTPAQAFAIGGGAAVTAMMVGIAGFKMVDVSGSTTTHDTTTYTQRIQHIVVDSGAASVTITGTPDRTVTVERTVTELVHRAHPQVDRTGDTLHLTGGCGGIPIARCTIKYQISVPSDVDITAEMFVGQLSASNLNANVSLDARNGSVSAYDINGGLSMSTESGRVSADRVQGGPVSLRASSGRISAWDVSAHRLDANTSSGRISLGFDHAPAAVQAHASSGSIAVLVPRDGTAYELDVDTDSNAGRVVRGVRHVDSAPQHRITAGTSSGRVVVDYSR